MFTWRLVSFAFTCPEDRQQHTSVSRAKMLQLCCSQRARQPLATNSLAHSPPHLYSQACRNISHLGVQGKTWVLGRQAVHDTAYRHTSAFYIGKGWARDGTLARQAVIRRTNSHGHQELRGGAPLSLNQQWVKC